MTTQTFVVPYARVSPLHAPRRDLVLGRGDSLSLRVSIIEADSTSARALSLTGGIGGPRLLMLVAPDNTYRPTWDYDSPATCPNYVLWTGTGAVLAGTPGTFEISFDAANMSGWPRRCLYALELDWCDGTAAELVIEGRLHLIRSAVSSPFIAPPLLDDDSTPVLEDDSDPVFA